MRTCDSGLCFERQQAGLPNVASLSSKQTLLPRGRSIATVRRGKMNPYETPKTEQSGVDGVEVATRGRRCLACGSTNTMTDFALRPKPSILMVILFGWMFLLIRGAFSLRTYQCRDCGSANRYKTVGSWLALAVLLFLAFCIVVNKFS